MTRARNLSKLSNPNVFTVDTSNNVGVGSSVPDVKLDVDGDAHIGAAITMYSTSGIVSATSFFGSAEGLTDLPAGGASLSASSGSQRVVVTSLTSGTMTAAGTNADLAYNTTTNTLSATTFSGALTGNVTGNASGTAGGLSGTPDITIQNVTGVAVDVEGGEGGEEMPAGDDMDMEMDMGEPDMGGDEPEMDMGDDDAANRGMYEGQGHMAPGGTDLSTQGGNKHKEKESSYPHKNKKVSGADLASQGQGLVNEEEDQDEDDKEDVKSEGMYNRDEDKDEDKDDELSEAVIEEVTRRVAERLMKRIKK